MASFKNQIPNLITLSNLFCGCLAIFFIYDGQLSIASFLVLLAALFDFADGLVARLLKVSGEMGKQLDSLADMVSFGLVPGTLAFCYLQTSLAQNGLVENGWSILKFFPFIITLFSAYRLAKFNIDTRQTQDFIGLNTPANTLLWISLPLFFKFQKPFLTNENFILLPISNFYSSLVDSPFLLCFLSIICSLMLVSEIRIFSLKFKHFNWKGNEMKFIFLGLSLFLLSTLWFAALPIVIILYVILSIIQNQIKKKHAV